MRNVIIIGSGPAAWTAAIYLARANLKPLVVAGKAPGGQLMTTSEVENYPGYEAILGPSLMQNFEQQAKKFGTDVINEDATKAEKGKKGFTVSFGGKKEQAMALIISTGSSYRKLDATGEKEYSARGVSYCAVCDAPFFKGKKVLVAGGGDSAMEESLTLAKFASEVFIAHRRDQFRASKFMQERVFAEKKIKVLWNTVVKEVLGNGKFVTGAKLLNNQTGKEQTVDFGGIFVAIGSEPNTAFLKGFLELDEKGYIVTDKRRHTSVEGVFAAGDVQDHLYRQAVTSAGSGCEAALEAQWYVENLKN